MENTVNNTQKIIEKLTEANRNLIKPETNVSDKDKSEKKKAIWKLVAKISLLLLVLLCFARVPFIGSYIDGAIDYLLGFGKYIFYALIIFVLIGWIFNTGYTRIIKSKKFVAFSILALFSACCIVSGVTGIMHSINEPMPFTDVMRNYHDSWLTYFKSWDYANFFNWKVTGGILAEIVAYAFVFLSNIVLIIIAAIILLFCIFIILNVNYRSTKIGLKIRAWMVRKLGGTFKYDGYNELKSLKNNQTKFKKVKRIDVEASAVTNYTIPFDLLPDTDIEEFNSNFKYARKIQNKLTSLFRNNKIDCVPTDINVYTSYSDICFETKSKKDVQDIINLQSKIAKTAKVDHFNISYKGNIVNIELENPFFSKISMKSALCLTTDSKTVRAVFGIKKNSDLATQDFKNNTSALIIGKKGSGAATLTALMTLSICYTTSPDDLELVILNPNCETTFNAFGDLPQAESKAFESINDCTEKLHELQRIVNERNSILKVNNVSNIEQYNKANTNLNQFRHILVVIANVDSLLKETFQNNKIINDILVNGRNAGVHLIMHSYKVNNDILDKSIYDAVTDKYILQLETKDESIKIFNNNRGYQLNSNGDCLHFIEQRIDNMERLQICNINYSELVADIDVVRVFYIAKVRRREEMILSEDKKW